MILVYLTADDPTSNHLTYNIAVAPAFPLVPADNNGVALTNYSEYEHYVLQRLDRGRSRQQILTDLGLWNGPAVQRIQRDVRERGFQRRIRLQQIVMQDEMDTIRQGRQRAAEIMRSGAYVDDVLADLLQEGVLVAPAPERVAYDAVVDRANVLRYRTARSANLPRPARRPRATTLVVEKGGVDGAQVVAIMRSFNPTATVRPAL